MSKEQKHMSNYINIPLTLEQWAIPLGKNVEPQFLANRFYKASGGPEDPIFCRCLSSRPWAIFPTRMSKGTSLQMHIFNFPWWKRLLRAVRVRLSCEWLKIQNRSVLNLVKTDVISHGKVGDPGLEWWPCHDQGLQHFLPSCSVFSAHSRIQHQPSHLHSRHQNTKKGAGYGHVVSFTDFS